MSTTPTLLAAARIDKVKANNDTIFVVNDDDDVTAYTGIKNVPDITAKDSKNGAVTVAVVMDNDYADVVYIYSADMSISGDSGDRVYLLEESPNASVDKDDNKYYEYDAIVNGEITTVKATDKDLKIGLYQNVSYDENGYMGSTRIGEWAPAMMTSRPTRRSPRSPPKLAC